MASALTLQQLNRRVAQTLATPALQNVWVVAELSDLRVNHGHCYMELIEKDPDTGAVNARMRAAIWANMFARINAEFYAATNQRLESGLKVMVCGSVNFHSAFGMSFIISAINPAFTMGEAERRRREILQRLQREGVLDLNRSLEWTDTPNRIAVISAPGAAGYGDFIHQLFTNSQRLRFSIRLFPAMMQGANTVPSVIAALDAIAAESHLWDGVVIIRGGGATSELAAFDDYNLAANVAQFPLPVIVGIGHERDVTVLDYVANMRVKTPTAAAEWLIARGTAALDYLRRTCAEILQCATGRIASSRTQLAYMQSTLDVAPQAAITRAQHHLQQATLTLAASRTGRIAPELTRLNATIQAIGTAAHNATTRAAERLSSRHSLLKALSPEATLSRGYSITTYQGRAVTDPAALPAGAELTTTVAHGSFTSTLTDTKA